MKIEFTHPAVVTGAIDAATPHRLLVRVKSTFEIAEYASSDLTPAFTVEKKLADVNVTRLDDMLFDDQVPLAARADPAELEWEVVGRDRTGFHGLYKTVDYFLAARQLSVYAQAAGGYHRESVRGTWDKVTKKDIALGLQSNLAKACLTATPLRNWRWLGADVDEQLAFWRGEAEKTLSNVIAVDGLYRWRTFEPCYLAYTPVNVSPSSTGVYARQVHEKTYSALGLENMGDHATDPGLHYFSALDRDAASDFLAEARSEERPHSKRPATRTKGIVVHDDTTVSDDFQERETVRAARLAIEHVSKALGRQMDDDPQLAVQAALFKATVDLVKRWQEGGKDADGALASARDLLDSMLHVAPGYDAKPRSKLYGVLDHLRLLELREATAPVSIPGFMQTP